MKRIAAFALGIVSAGAFGAAALAADIDDMIGKWKWQDFVVECAKGGDFGISCKVASGPKNVGMEMIQSAMKKDGDHFVGKVKHPVNEQVYNTKITMADKDTWRLDGCTADGACASGTFVRVK